MHLQKCPTFGVHFIHKEENNIENKIRNQEQIENGRIFYERDENWNCVRTREVKIGKTAYYIISRQSPNAKTSAFDISKRLIERQAESLTDDLSITTESLEGCNSGGKKQ